MSNLSDLLPAGGGAKVITATADGNLATGQTVALQSNGTVKGITAIAESLGEAQTVTTDSLEQNVATYDTNSNRVVRATRNGSSSDTGYAYVSTVSGSTITSGTGVQFESGTTADLDIAFDSTNNKVLIIYVDSGDSAKGKAVVGTVDPSDNSISYGSIAIFHTGGTANPRLDFSPTAGRFLIVYEDTADSEKGKGIVATISGTSVGFGSTVEFESGAMRKATCVYDSTADKFVTAYMDEGNSNYGTAVVGTVSGSSVSFGSPVVFASASTQEIGAAYDSTANKHVFNYKDQGNSNNGTSIVGTVSGTSMTFGTEVVFDSTGEASDNVTVFDPSAGKVVVHYGMWDGATATVRYAVGTVSGTSITFETPVVLSGFLSGQTGMTYDPTAEKVIIVYRGTSSPYGLARTLQLASTTSNNFAGITNQAINNSASGEVVVEGGVITNASLLPLAYTGSLGSAAVYQSTATEYQGIAFDSSNNKIVVAYKDDSNQHGTAAVGTVSGTGITWGTPVVFAAASTSYVDVTFDSSNNKVVIVYSDVANSEYGTAIVGTVSGTSISFGSEVVFASAATVYIKAGFDSNSNKVVVAYSDNGNSSYGTAIVGTVSGTSISFGTEVVFDSTGTLSAAFGGFVFDSTNNKIVIPYTRATSFCIVGTVSGTSISFGTTVAFGGTIAGQNLSVAFDSNAGKVVINYRDSNNSDYFGSLVGTVSGTSISFGTELVIEEVHNLGATTFDSSDNTIVYFYKSSSLGYYRIGTVSGTSISYGSAVSLISNNIAYMAATFDSNQNTSVVVYKDAGNSNYGTAKGLQVSGAVPNFTIGSTYYVQNDGTLGTGSTSVTAGKAIANTTLLLKG